MAVSISAQTLRRLPSYLQYLEKARDEGVERITATTVAAALGRNGIQVRKDLAAVSRTPGKPMVGFAVGKLIADVKDFLHAERTRDAVLVGAGALGRALMGYEDFAAHGLRIVAAFDEAPSGRAGVYAMRELEHICRRLDVRVGIVTVPADAAQEICDRLTACGVRAIWNFAPTFLRAPRGVVVQNEILASSLAELTRRMRDAEGES